MYGNSDRDLELISQKRNNNNEHTKKIMKTSQRKIPDGKGDVVWQIWIIKNIWDYPTNMWQYLNIKEDTRNVNSKIQ